MAGDTQDVMARLDECAMVGAAVLASQRVEFLLYGLIAHLNDQAREQDRKFRNLSPEKFLRGDVRNLRATLGQMVKAFGDKLLLTTADLEQFVNDRNLIVHSYWRLTKSGIVEAQSLEEPEKFLITFLHKCDHWEKVLRGLMAHLRIQIAKNVGNEEKAQVTTEDQRLIEYYDRNAEKHLKFRESPPLDPPKSTSKSVVNKSFRLTDRSYQE